MSQTAAEAVVDQRIATLETMCENLTRRVEVLKAVVETFCQEHGGGGAAWRSLCKRAQRKLEARKARDAVVA